MKRLSAIAAASLFAVAANAAAAQDLPSTVYVAAQQPGTLQNTVASAVAKVVTDGAPTTAVVRPFSGTTAFFPVLDGGEVDFGLAPSVDFAMSFQGDKLKIGGINPYPRTKGLRLVASGSPLLAGMLVRTDAEVNHVSELKGKSVAGEFPAQLGAFVNTYVQLYASGLTWDDVKVVPAASIAEGMDALMQNRLQAVVYGVGAPKVKEAEASVGVKFVSVTCTDEAKKWMTETAPGYYTVSLDPGRLAGITEEDTCVTAYDLYLVTHEGASDELVTAVTKALYENAEKLGDFHPTLKRWTKEGSVRTRATIPFHPAAVAFYKEAGAWSPEMDAVQDKLMAAATE